MTKDLARDRVIHAVLERQRLKYGNRTFFYFKDREFSYNDFSHAADRVACGLQKMGITKGNKVAILLDNCPEFLFLWFGLSKLGAVEVPINTAHKGDLLTYMLNMSDARVLFTHSKYLDRVEPVLVHTLKIESMVVLETLEKGIPNLAKPILDWAKLIDNDGDYRPEDILWSDPLAIMFTSGTTGPSKGPLMPQNYPLFTGEICIEAAEYDEKDCLYNTTPLFHGMAQFLSTVPALMSGARMVLAERFSASHFWEDIKHYGCTTANYIGGIIPILYKADPEPDDADNPLRVMFGAAAPKNLFEAFEKRFGVTLVEVYGMTEVALPLMSNLRDRKPGSCGKPRASYLVQVSDENGTEIGPHQVGEMLVRPLKPYTMMLEYYKMPEKTVETWRNLWFQTGDYAYYDEEGYFFFVDRKKDALRRRGENISSFEVEKVMNSHPAVLESAAIAVKSDLGEDDVMVCLTLKPEHNVKPLDLIIYCEERMAYFMVPRYLRFMDSLPKTPTERVQKYRLREEGVTPDTWDREVEGYQLKR